jgi:hypothetical protein
MNDDTKGPLVRTSLCPDGSYHCTIVAATPSDLNEQQSVRHGYEWERVEMLFDPIRFQVSGRIHVGAMVCR